MPGPLRLSYVLLANNVPKCQMSSGPYGPIFVQLKRKKYAAKYYQVE